MSNTHCPDCGQEYRDPMEVLPRPSEELEVKSVPWSEWTAEVHRDNECPVQEERDHAEALERVVRYFGIADTLKRIAELMGGENEHDGEIIWGNGERYFRREQERGKERQLICPSCDAQLGVIRDGRCQVGPAYIELAALTGTEELICHCCHAGINLKQMVATPEQGERSGGIGTPRPLKLVEPKEVQEDV